MDTSVTTTKKITVQEAYNSISGLTALAGTSVTAASDSVPIYQSSTGTAKKITVTDLGSVFGTVSAATQAEQETATSTTVYVPPGRQQYHPSSPKAWGFITPATTISASYPAVGVSVVKNATGDYTITHGQTFSSTNVAAIAIAYGTNSGSFFVTKIHSIPSATTIRILIFDNTVTLADPTNFSYALYGDLA